MIPSIRTAYNQQFTPEKYEAFLAGIASDAGIAPAFRVAETPVFIPASLTSKLVQACEEIIDVLLRPDFKTLTQNAIPQRLKVPNENEHPHFIVIDFAVTREDDGSLAPQLIELQGFPTMFAFQEVMARRFKEHFEIPANFSNYFNNLDDTSYYDLLRKVILGDLPPEEVILLEVKPAEQKTRIDFHRTEKMLGISTVCLTELIQEGKKLYYLKDGKKTPVRRIFNRVIFDDLEKQAEQLGDFVNLFQDLDVEWITHPNWFYRISKFMMPFIHSDYVPKSWFLHQLPVLPTDLENYVLKPLFSFAGKGVLLDVTQEEIDKIDDPENWILQRKVQYAPAIVTPTGPAICEIRMIYVWPDGAIRPMLVHNLARISKSRMIGVAFNTQDTWVGGSCCFFER
jgi:glutathionylspermidine synthase